MAKTRGFLLTLEGVDGSGKSTQARLLASALRRRGLDVLLTREPGGSPRAARIRALLLDPRLAGLHPEAELLLFAADRRQHVADTLEPALAKGLWVVCDRFTDSTLAYQGAREGLDPSALRQAVRLASAGLVPDLTLWFDLPPERGLARARAAKGRGDRMEASALSYYRRVRKGFSALAKAHPRRIRRVGVLGRSPERVLEDCLGQLEPFLRARRPGGRP